jgi:hypothetical protein
MSTIGMQRRLAAQLEKQQQRTSNSACAEGKTWRSGWKTKKGRVVPGKCVSRRTGPSNITVKQLKSRAKAAGIKGYSKLKKAQLQGMLANS